MSRPLEERQTRINAAAVDQTRLDTVSAALADTAGAEQSLRIAGLNGEPMLEPVAKYVRSSGETVYKNGNLFIVIGRDRPGGRDSGYGGKGHTGASSVDIVAGRQCSPTDSALNYDPNLAADAARLYISQKTDIDDNFRLGGGGSAGSISKARSGAALKADAVRLIGRDNIKLFTRTEATNSRGGAASHDGIYLIASNDVGSLQPMVKGNSLVSTLREMDDRIRELHAIVLKFQNDQHSYNMKLLSHTHEGSAIVGPVTTAPALSIIPKGIQVGITAVECLLDSFKSRINLELMEFNRLSGITGQGFNSSYNKVN